MRKTQSVKRTAEIGCSKIHPSVVRFTDFVVEMPIFPSDESLGIGSRPQWGLAT
jgi:hypothetical protein